MFVILAKIRETEENVPENEKDLGTEKKSGVEGAVDASKENTENEPEEKEPENKVLLWSQLGSWFPRDVGRGYKTIVGDFPNIVTRCLISDQGVNRMCCDNFLDLY